MNRFKSRNFDGHVDIKTDKYVNPFLDEDLVKSNSLYDSSVTVSLLYLKSVSEDGRTFVRRIGDVELAFGNSPDVSSSISPSMRLALQQKLLSMPHNTQSSDIVQSIGRSERYEISESVSNFNNYLNNIQTDEPISDSASQPSDTSV